MENNNFIVLGRCYCRRHALSCPGSVQATLIGGCLMDVSSFSFMFILTALCFVIFVQVLSDHFAVTGSVDTFLSQVFSCSAGFRFSHSTSSKPLAFATT